ncbi:hypothetical protein MSAN_01905200 [Mycena sanguinolenta]|uniref:Uncharacterized protein n=1 Tax=Mycena sanguinolenta TaxID=230812 RepID=A0A8H6XP01_9AGAR|nr:hypothetical protein MSAN_01905200 [Mycena sanguinolenta]
MTRTTIFQILALLVLPPWLPPPAPAPDTLVTLVDPIGGGGAPMTITAAILGVDADGHTTYAYTRTVNTSFAQATVTATEHATLVAASNYFSLTDEVAGTGFVLLSGGECQIALESSASDANGPNAICTMGTRVVTKTSIGTLVLDIPSPTDKPSSAGGRSTNNSGLPIVGVALLFVTLSLACQLL